MLVLLPFLVHAEGDDTTAIPEKPRARAISNVVFQFDNRNERYFGTKARMNGLKLGLESYKRVRFGFGFYANNNFYRIPNPAIDDSILRTGKLNYSTFFTEIVFYRSFRWEVSLIGATGGGRLRVNNFSNDASISRFIRQDVYEKVKIRDVAVNGQFKIFPWLGVGAGLGYRNVVNLPDENLRDAYRVPYIDFKLKIFLGYAVKSIFKPSKIEEEKAYYAYRKKKRHEAFKALFKNE